MAILLTPDCHGAGGEVHAVDIAVFDIVGKLHGCNYGAVVLRLGVDAPSEECR